MYSIYQRHGTFRCLTGTVIQWPVRQVQWPVLQVQWHTRGDAADAEEYLSVLASGLPF